MPNLEQLNNQKEMILSTIKLRGPSLPVQIAKAIGVSPLFASAFLSELGGEDKLKVSNMRVGSSPLYYLQGQESMLENFVHFLNQREREAFEHLKRNLILDDLAQTPVMRVALRAIKDFAVSVKVRINGEAKLFWKHHLLDDNEIGRIISGRLKGLKSPEKFQERVEDKKEEAEKETLSPSQANIAKQIVQPAQKEVIKEKGEVQRELTENKKIKKGAKKIQESEFAKDVRKYLFSKDIELLEVFLEKKREFEGRVRIDTSFGKQEFYLVALDKKSASNNDLTIAWQKAHGMKIQALVMSTGELNKKGKEHLKDWGNLIKWEKLKF